MGSKFNPVCGSCQPTNKHFSKMPPKPMTPYKKRDTLQCHMRQIVAANLDHLLRHHFGDEKNLARKLAAHVSCSMSTIQRITAGEVGASIDTLEEIANFFHLQVYQLLIHDLDVTNPQIVPQISMVEKDFWTKLRNASRTHPVIP